MTVSIDIDAAESKQATVPDEQTTSHASVERQDSRDSCGSKSSGQFYLCASSSPNSMRIKLRPEDLKGVSREILDELDQDGDHNITFQEVIREATKCREAEHHAKLLRRIVIALVIAVCCTVALNCISTIISIEASKESHVINRQMVDPDGLKVRVASSDMKVKGDGQLCPLSESGECLSGSVKTGDARSYANLFDLPLFDSKTLSSLREVTLLLRNGLELTLTIVGNMKHKGGKSATLYAHSGNKLVVDGTTMTAFAFVEGQLHVVENPKQRLRRLQEGGQWQPQLYDERDFFTPENGFNVTVDARTGRRLQRHLNADSQLSGWAALAMSIGEAIVGYYEGVGQQPVQQHASIRGHLTITTITRSGKTESEVTVDVAILYNKTVPSHSRLYFATGGQSWLTAFGQSMEFAYDAGMLQSCEVLSSPAVPGLIPSAVTLGEESGVLTAFPDTDNDGKTYQVAMEIVSFDVDMAADDLDLVLQVPNMDECSSSRRLDSPADSGVEGREYLGNGTLDGRRLADVIDSVGWEISKATYGFAGWQQAHGDREYRVTDTLPGGWSFKVQNGECANSHAVAKIVRNADATIAVSFVEFENLHDVILRAANRDSTIIGHVQNIIRDNEDTLFPCLGGKIGNDRVKFLIGHGIGGAVAVSYYKNQGGQGQGKLTSDAVVVTYGAPPTGPDECNLPGTRYQHVNDALGSDLLSTEDQDHEMESGKTYDDTSYRRRYKSWERRRTSTWEWTSNCVRKSSDSFSNVDAVLNFNVYDNFFP